MVTWEEAIEEAYASAPSDEILLHTLELQHVSFGTTPIRVVRDTGVLIENPPAATQYTNAEVPLYGQILGGDVYVACMFDLTFPNQEENKLPQINFSLDNVSRELATYLDIAITQKEAIRVVYRQWLLSQPDTVQYTLQGMSVKKVKTNNNRVVATAVFDDLINKSFPSKIYSSNNYPGLTW